jgi:hypothetical protein
MPVTKKNKIKSFLPDAQMKNVNSILKIKQKYNKTLSETSQKQVVSKSKSNKKHKRKSIKLRVGAKPRKPPSYVEAEAEAEAEAEEGAPLTLNKKEYERYMLEFNYSKVWDLEYASYKDNEEYKALAKVNPSIYSVNGAFYGKHNKSFIAALMNEENAGFLGCLNYYLHLKTLVEDSEGIYPIIDMLIKHGFNTIYDILLENNESFYLVAFIAHLSSFSVVENANDFLISLKTNKLHKALRDKDIIAALQKAKLYTRVKRFQLAGK